MGIGRTIAPSTNPNIASSKLPPKKLFRTFPDLPLAFKPKYCNPAVIKLEPLEWGLPRLVVFDPVLLIWAIRGGQRWCNVERWLGLINKTVRHSSRVNGHLSRIDGGSGINTTTYAHCTSTTEASPSNNNPIHCIQES